jgi:fimbrial chaperone protein
VKRIAASLCLVAAPWAAASTFTVSPIRLHLDGAARTEALTLHNANDSPVVVQVQAVEWTQSAGADRFAPTRDIIATPQVLTLAPGAEAIVRVALRREVHPTRELTYRIFIQEVPPADAPVTAELNIALRLSLPIFITPSIDPAAQLEWKASWLDEHSLRLQASNTGEAHVQLFEVGVAPGPAVKAGTYVLPGSEGSWVVPVPREADRAGVISIRATSDAGEWTAEVLPR